MIFKTVVPAIGSIESYKDKPIKDRTYNSSSKQIGKIIDARPVNEGYEIIMQIEDVEFLGHFNGSRLMSMTLE